MASRKINAMTQGKPSKIYSQWTPYSQISKNYPLAILASEDQLFPEHYGFDFKSMWGAVQSNMKGKKIRVIENALYVRTVQAFGGNPVPMAWPEVYTALQQRTIDGVDTNYHGMADSKLFEVAKSLAITDHIFTATVYVMNLKKFQSLSPAHQDVVLRASRAAGETMRAGAAKANEDAIALMEKNGVKLIRPDRPPFENAVAGVHKFFSTMVGADLLKEVADAQR